MPRSAVNNSSLTCRKAVELHLPPCPLVMFAHFFLFLFKAQTNLKYLGTKLKVHFFFFCLLSRCSTASSVSHIFLKKWSFQGQCCGVMDKLLPVVCSFLNACQFLIPAAQLRIWHSTTDLFECLPSMCEAWKRLSLLRAWSSPGGYSLLGSEPAKEGHSLFYPLSLELLLSNKQIFFKATLFKEKKNTSVSWPRGFFAQFYLFAGLI